MKRKKIKFNFIVSEKKEKEEKLIKVGSEEDKIYCSCGKQMTPKVMSHTVIYSCPKVRLWNFWNHSVNQVFSRYSPEEK